MKTFARILIILLAALVVVGVTMAVTHSSTAHATTSFQGDQPPQMGDREGGSPLGWLSHLIPIAGIIFVVVIVEKFWRKIFKPRLA